MENEYIEDLKQMDILEYGEDLNNEPVAATIVKKGDGPMVEQKLDLHIPNFDFTIACKLIERVSTGHSIKRALEGTGLTPFHLQIWRKQVPKFGEALKVAKMSRAELITENLVDILGDMVNDEGKKNDPRFLSQIAKLSERITSIHDPSQNLKAGNQVNIQTNINTRPETDVEVKDVFTGQEDSRTIEELRSDVDKEEFNGN